MLQRSYFLILLTLFACQKDNDFLPRQAQILAGSWDRIAYEEIVNGTKTWVADTADGRADLTVRSDGVLLDQSGFGFCSSPKTLIVNGKAHSVNPQSSVPYDESCNVKYFPHCGLVEFQVKGDALISFGCDGLAAARYRRIP